MRFPKNNALFARALWSFVSIAGCNAIWGNEKGYLVLPDASGGAAGQGGNGDDAAVPRADVFDTGVGAAGRAGGGGAGGAAGVAGSGAAGVAGSGAADAGRGEDGEGGVGDANADRDTHRDHDEPGDAGPICDTGTVCDQRCTNVLSDPKHCGACGHVCATAYACVEGRCDSEVVEVAVGVGISCAVLRGGQAWCWGHNHLGQLGDGSLAGTETCGMVRCRPKAAPIVDSDGIAPMQDVAHIEASFYHACAVKKTGSVFCWGLNSFGQLGHSGGDATCTDPSGAVVPCNAKPTLVGLPGGVRVAQISSGLYYTCAASTTGDVYCWGNNDYGQLGLPLDTASVAIPTRVTGLSRPAVQIGMGVQGNLSCALLDDATVWCWGHSAFGAAGHDPTPDPACGASKCNPEPKVVADNQGRPLSGVARIAVGRSVACALTQMGSVMCWGWNGFGTLGNGTADNAVHASPQLVSGLPPVTRLSLGDLTILASDANGAVWGWGRNNFGAVGDGTITGNAPIDGGACSQPCRWRPTRATVTNLQQIAIRGNTSIALGTNGALWVWGQNPAGELGHSPGTAGDIMCGVESATPGACDPRPTIFNFVPVIPPAPLPLP